MNETRKEEFIELLNSKTLIYIFMHDFPDPDAIGAAVGLERLIKEISEKPVIIFGRGISHPQNRTMVNALNLDLKDPFDYFKDHTGHSDAAFIWVDFNSSSTNFEFGANFDAGPDWVIDHHIDKDKPLTPNQDIEPVGASCTLVYEYMQMFDIHLDDEDDGDTQVATAMLLGITTDTDNLKASTSRDLTAFEWLKKYYNADIYRSIESYELNSYFFDVLDTAYKHREQIGSLLILNLGFLSESRRDAIPFVADLWKKNKDVSIVIAFGIIKNTITASARVKGLGTLKANDLVRGVFQSPNSGGHSQMAGATVALDPFFDTALLGDKQKETLLEAIMAMIVERAKHLADLDE